MPRTMVSTRTTAKPYDRPEDADELDSDAPDSKPEVSGDEYVEGSKKTQANPKAVKAKAVPKKKTPNTKVKTEGASGGTASGKWTPEEDWALFLQIHPRASRADWNAIAAVVGRDAKSCSNRYYAWDRHGKLEAAIKSMSGV